MSRQRPLFPVFVVRPFFPESAARAIAVAHGLSVCMPGDSVRGVANETGLTEAAVQETLGELAKSGAVAVMSTPANGDLSGQVWRLTQQGAELLKEYVAVGGKAVSNSKTILSGNVIGIDFRP